MNVGSFNILKVRMQHLRHGRARDIGALFRKAALDEIAACMLGIGHIHVGYYIDDPAVRLLREALILAAGAGLHMKNGYMQALRRDSREAGIRIAKYEKCVRLYLRHELIRAVYYAAHGLAEVAACGVHIHLRRGDAEIAEKDAVEIIVIVLSGVGEDAVKILPAFADDCGKPDYLGTCADYDEQLQSSVIFEFYIRVVKLHAHTSS